jgi:hypothetical protein
VLHEQILQGVSVSDFFGRFSQEWRSKSQVPTLRLFFGCERTVGIRILTSQRDATTTLLEQ